MRRAGAVAAAARAHARPPSPWRDRGAAAANRLPLFFFGLRTSQPFTNQLVSHVGSTLVATAMYLVVFALGAVGVCARPAAWAALSSRVHGLIVSKAFGGSAAQALALQVLLVAGAFAVAPPPGSVQVPAPPSVSPAAGGEGVWTRGSTLRRTRRKWCKC